MVKIVYEFTSLRVYKLSKRLVDLLTCKPVNLLIILLLLVFLPSSSQAGLFDFLKGSAAEHEEGSVCGGQIKIFKKFLHDGRICKQNDDCIAVNSDCPVGCNLYINKNFIQIMQTEMGKVDEACSGSVCAYKCDKVKAQPVECVRNKCQVKQRL